jgi:Tol biopolymer transport system component
MRTILISVIIFCLLAILTACQPKPLLPIPEGRIVFSLQVTRYPFSDSDIYIIDTDGSGAKRLTDNPNRGFDPSWSPDGTQIVFISDYKLFKMNADGSHLMTLARIYPEGSAVPSDEAVDPDWSPDGRKIIFTSYFQIKEIDLESGKVSDLVTSSQRVLYPKWSPDGTKIMFISVHEGQVFIMNANGSDPRQITKSFSLPVLLDWSPDGRWIAVKDEYDALSIMRPDGSNQRKLTDQCKLPYFEPSAAFSPDSQWLVMTCYNEKEPGIYVINLEEGILRKLINHLPVEYFNGIDWAP